MIRLGMVIIIGAVIASMAAGMYMYTQYQTNYIEAAEGETVRIGPVEYVITFEGTHKGGQRNRA